MVWTCLYLVYTCSVNSIWDKIKEIIIRNDKWKKTFYLKNKSFYLGTEHDVIILKDWRRNAKRKEYHVLTVWNIKGFHVTAVSRRCMNNTYRIQKIFASVLFLFCYLRCQRAILRLGKFRRHVSFCTQLCKGLIKAKLFAIVKEQTYTGWKLLWIQYIFHSFAYWLMYLILIVWRYLIT